MLYEIQNPRQIPGEPFRRWFYSHEQDLYVWYDDSGSITAFQLSYGKSRNEHAIYWRSDRGYSHLRVDEGRRSATPFLVADGAFDRDRVLNNFRELSIELPFDVTEFVDARLVEYNTAKGGKPWWQFW